MALTRQQHDQAMEWLRDIFESDVVRLLLSLLIILSVLPFGWVQDYSMVFFAIFAVELALRVSVLINDLRHRDLSRVELLFLLFDVLATLSFLPIEAILDDARFLRLFRLSRMLLLLGYWGPIVREVWYILMKRERRYQIVFVVASALILSFISAVLLNHFHSLEVDFNDDGNLGNDSSFWAMLWWSFRQIQDPGNILKDPNASLAFFFSLFLTISGMFLFSFLIGIGTSVVEELVALGKQRRLGARQHSVICNVSPYSRVLMEELVTYYRKSFRPPRIVAMGAAPTRHGYMLEGPLQRIRYRQGRPLSAHDLIRVDADRAKRVILLGHEDHDLSDSQVISQVLSVREQNPECDIYAELHRPGNMQAALTAGGSRTVPIITDQLVGLFMANIMVFPGVQEIYWELLTSKGDEVYTCLFDRGALTGYRPPSGPMLPFGDLLERCHRAHGVILLGHLIRDEDEPLGFTHALNPGSPRGHAPTPPAVPPVDRLAGFFGVADNFERLKGFVESLPDVAAADSAPAPETPPLPGLSVCPASANLHQILICGFHEGLVDFCEQLVLFRRKLKIVIMVPRKEQVPQVGEAFVRRKKADSGGPWGRRRVHFIQLSEDRVQYETDGPRPATGLIRVVSGDWSDENFIRKLPGQDRGLEQMDAVLFTYAAGEADPDARTALGLIKLMHLQQAAPELLKPSLRIVCEVQSTEKSNLFRRRFGRAGAGPDKDCQPVAFVPAERLRNSVLAQSVFVPGIAPLYQELLGETGQEICRLLVEPPPGPESRWTFSRLLAAIHRQHNLLLIAVELRDPEGGPPQVIVNPRRGEDGYRFQSGQLASLFVVGEVTDLPRAERPCIDCFTGGTPAPAEPPQDMS